MFLAPPMREVSCDPDHDRGRVGDNPPGTSKHEVYFQEIDEALRKSI
jgi:hypothetical protein